MTNSTWLTAAGVATVIGSALAEAVDATSLQQWCNGAASYVEERRPDLWVTTTPDDPDTDDVDETVLTYTPTQSVLIGASLLAYRLYSRRTTPLGVLGFNEDGATGILREDPDISKLLGIGRFGKFVFGAGRAPVEAEVV